MRSKPRVLALASGEGGNIKFLHAARKLRLVEDFDLAVVADRACGALRFARQAGLDHKLVTYQRSSPSQLQQVLEGFGPDIVLTTWHKIIDAETVRMWDGKLVNLHYSLLPAFAGEIGMRPLQLAYERGCQFVGPTCHLVDEGVDSGKVLAQAAFRTDVSYDVAVSAMFRLGCAVLILGMQRVVGFRLDEGLSTATIAAGVDCWFSPRLPAGTKDALLQPLWLEVARSPEQ